MADPSSSDAAAPHHAGTGHTIRHKKKRKKNKPSAPPYQTFQVVATADDGKTWEVQRPVGQFDVLMVDPEDSAKDGFDYKKQPGNGKFRMLVQLSLDNYKKATSSTGGADHHAGGEGSNGVVSSDPEEQDEESIMALSQSISTTIQDTWGGLFLRKVDKDDTTKWRPVDTMDAEEEIMKVFEEQIQKMREGKGKIKMEAPKQEAEQIHTAVAQKPEELQQQQHQESQPQSVPAEQHNPQAAQALPQNHSPANAGHAPELPPPTTQATPTPAPSKKQKTASLRKLPMKSTPKNNSTLNTSENNGSSEAAAAATPGMALKFSDTGTPQFPPFPAELMSPWMPDDHTTQNHHHEETTDNAFAAASNRGEGGEMMYDYDDPPPLGQQQQQQPLLVESGDGFHANGPAEKKPPAKKRKRGRPRKGETRPTTGGPRKKKKPGRPSKAQQQMAEDDGAATDEKGIHGRKKRIDLPGPREAPTMAPLASSTAAAGDSALPWTAGKQSGLSAQFIRFADREVQRQQEDGQKLQEHHSSDSRLIQPPRLGPTFPVPPLEDNKDKHETLKRAKAFLRAKEPEWVGYYEKLAYTRLSMYCNGNINKWPAGVLRHTVKRSQRNLDTTLSPWVVEQQAMYHDYCAWEEEGFAERSTKLGPQHDMQTGMQHQGMAAHYVGTRVNNDLTQLAMEARAIVDASHVSQAQEAVAILHSIANAPVREEHNFTDAKSQLQPDTADAADNDTEKEKPAAQASVTVTTGVPAKMPGVSGTAATVTPRNGEAADNSTGAIANVPSTDTPSAATNEQCPNEARGKSVATKKKAKATSKRKHALPGNATKKVAAKSNNNPTNDVGKSNTQTEATISCTDKVTTGSNTAETKVDDAAQRDANTKESEAEANARSAEFEAERRRAEDQAAFQAAIRVAQERREAKARKENEFREMQRAKILLLDAIHFVWRPDQEPPSEAPDEWKESFLDLREYLRSRGDTAVPDTVELGVWAQLQRMRYQRSLALMSEDSVDNLSAAVGTSQSKRKSPLATTPLSRRQMDALRGLGFDYEDLESSRFFFMYMKLLEFKNRVGDCLVPPPKNENVAYPDEDDKEDGNTDANNEEKDYMVDDHADPRLYFWVQRVRFEYIKFQEAKKAEERAEAAAAGVDEDGHAIVEQLLAEEKTAERAAKEHETTHNTEEENDDCTVVGHLLQSTPLLTKSTGRSVEDAVVGNGSFEEGNEGETGREIKWNTTSAKNPKGKTAQKQQAPSSDSVSTLTQAHIDLLNSIGFIWSVDISDRWCRQYRRLHAFYIKNGHSKVTKTTNQSKTKLNRWCSQMRSLYQRNFNGEKSALSQEKIDLLKRLDFIFEFEDLPERLSFKERFKMLKQFKEENGHCNVPQIHPTLGHFVKRLRKEYEAHKKGVKVMNPEKMRMCNEIGFLWRVRVVRGTKRRTKSVPSSDEKEEGEEEEEEEDDDDDDEADEHEEEEEEEDDDQGGNDNQEKETTRLVGESAGNQQAPRSKLSHGFDFKAPRPRASSEASSFHCGMCMRAIIFACAQCGDCQRSYCQECFESEIRHDNGRVHSCPTCSGPVSVPGSNNWAGV